MKKLVFAFMCTLLAINVFGQGISHSIAIEAGCSVMDEGIGPQLGTRYLMGITRHLDVVVSLSSSNGVLHDETLGKYKAISFCSTSLGVESHVDFLSICSMGLLVEGGMAMHAKNDVMYLRPTLGGVGLLAFRVASAMEIGVYYGKTWMAYSNELQPAMGKFGVMFSYQVH